MTKVSAVPVSAITLVYKCAEDSDEEHYQPLADIVSVGTLICPECGDDMDLTGTVVTL